MKSGLWPDFLCLHPDFAVHGTLGAPKWRNLHGSLMCRAAAYMQSAQESTCAITARMPLPRTGMP
ncbi:hypothetical protein SCFA_660033 [anaerobic digester metagenome]|uniref:Uncharacterized protein n=1 Tax=anaerobic digester metagenome TaxID=1263854 RepID=A0A485M3C3_9ZZZZ